MNTHPFDAITIDSGARFIFTPCPGTKEATLTESVEQLKQAGAQAIITLMYQQEMDKNQANQLPQICEQQGLGWFQLPISDDAAPNEDFLSKWHEQVADILAILKQQGTIAVHCKGGSGRTGLVIGLLMNELGVNKEQAKTLVQSVRPKALSQPVQLNYYNEFVGK